MKMLLKLVFWWHCHRCQGDDCLTDGAQDKMAEILKATFEIHLVIWFNLTFLHSVVYVHIEHTKTNIIVYRDPTHASTANYVLL